MYYYNFKLGLILDQFSQMLKITNFLITVNQEGFWPMYNLLLKESNYLLTIVYSKYRSLKIGEKLIIKSWIYLP